MQQSHQVIGVDCLMPQGFGSVWINLYQSVLSRQCHIVCDRVYPMRVVVFQLLRESVNQSLTDLDLMMSVLVWYCYEELPQLMMVYSVVY